ncbi:Zn(II)2Cys6 transcription factor domain-containing protein [Aspergillus alliaceus]|uniref:Zn(II)2Cys6 transcription factor domain-containing protein n=1 Tax=Petromyces alliaceus TaxID=209559 RepID=UPI0012A5F1E9|nr:uncharacterized protein BDW43DRAFT_304093 [Aspergillus alliaceus]KAB8228170.1 hypothetical protein BDW43DRAFT_304093 [Aspergillus alliaceus]
MLALLPRSLQQDLPSFRVRPSRSRSRQRRHWLQPGLQTDAPSAPRQGNNFAFEGRLRKHIVVHVWRLIETHDCRKRKIKCDEQQPECGQCRRGGRTCHIIDSLFKPHSYSFITSPQQHSHSSPGPQERGESSATPCDGLDTLSSVIERSAAAVSDYLRDKESVPPVLSPPLLSDPSVENHNLPETRTPIEPPSLPGDLPQETHQDQCEVAFFLRYYCEFPGQWMDLWSSQPSYFAQHVVSLSRISSVVRYAACALAAKQLGQLKDYKSRIQHTLARNVMLDVFADSKLDFLWYGANQFSPDCIRQPGLTPEGSDDNFLGEYDSTTALQILTACILCQYEDPSLTVTARAWSGHLDGIFKLLRSYLNHNGSSHLLLQIPDPLKGIDAMLWYFAFNDMLDAYDLSMWQKVGLPLDSNGQLAIVNAQGTYIEGVMLKALTRLLCLLLNSQLNDIIQWNHIDRELDQWHDILPASFLSPITWPPSKCEDETRDSTFPSLFSFEVWYSKDICAISMAFYYMARILMLISQPIFWSATKSLQQDLRQHASKIIPIAFGDPKNRVRKYILQPLYVTGRCLVDAKERKHLLHVIAGIDDDLGVFTGYRQKDLSEEWGIPYDAVESRVCL